MTLQIVRFLADHRPVWGVHQAGQVTHLAGDWLSTGEFLAEGGPEAAELAVRRLDHELAISALPDLRLLSPVTVDGDFICQGLNYASHLRELGMDPEKATQNVIFHKASSSLCGANDEVIRPRNVQALDYELELGLVVGRSIEGPIEVTPETLPNFIAGMVIVNDISARDIQIATEQFCKAKSYRTFGPTGPFLTLPTAQEWTRWGELMLTLSVNGELRQRAPASDMLHKPWETLRELSEIRDLKPGDLIATGTPAGVALRSPGKIKSKLAMLMSPARRGEIVAGMAQNDPRYLQVGDVITASIATADGAIDLGAQRNLVADQA